MTTADPSRTRSDADLLRELSAGEGDAREAWSVLVQRHSVKLYAVARSFGVDQVTAEDLVQTAWLRLVERADQLRDPAAVGAWLCAIVRNEARRYLSRRREIPTALDLDIRPDENPPADVQVMQEERRHALRLAFARLGGECRQLLRLLLAEPPLSYDELAVAIGRPRGSLGPTRRRCLDQLRARLPPGIEL